MEIQISVRGMVEFLFRNGDIDNTIAGAPADAMLEGGRIHRLIQKRAGNDYEAEVPLSHVVDFGEYSLKLDGRADGIITNDTGVVIDEIKGTYRDLKNIRAPKPEHLAQAKCYAYIYLSQNDLSEIKVRMTYCNIDTEEIRYFYEDLTAKEITEWFDNVMSEYKRWTDYSVAWQVKRNESLEGLKFPYEYRDGQKELMENVYKTIYHKKKLFIQAPTGVGKTLATIYPTILSGNRGMCDKLFYLTAKTVTGAVAVNAFDILRQGGLSYKSLQITAKEKVCANEVCDCNPVACPYAKGHFDRVNDALYDLLINEEDLRRETIAKYAEKHMVCPFELSLDASLFADAIVCDYNYAFDPHVYLKRFFADGATGKNYVFLIDEAHNLLERGRDMYSAILVKENFLEVRRILKGGPLPAENRFVKRINKWIDKCNSELLKLKKVMDKQSIGIEINTFVGYVQNLYLAYNAYLDEKLQTPDDEAFLQLYFDISHFLGIYEEIDDNYVIYTDMAGNGDFFLKLYCVNPAKLLGRCMDRGRSSILFSATFLPIQYYKKLLGGSEEDYEVYAQSIFDPSKRGVFIGEGVSTLYTERSETQYANIASYIRSVTSCKKGNYMVFFPSHAFLTSVYDAFELSELPFMEDTECIIQENVMKEEDRERFLSMFETPTEGESSKTLIGFCVLGGIFSEGIDLKGDSLIGSIVVGPGIPQICKERGILKDFFSAHGENGFDYAYRYPGMNKVLQAAGRVIRTANDIGIVALLDNRFKNYDYRRLFPREWEDIKSVNPASAKESIRDFWTNFEGKT